MLSPEVIRCNKYDRCLCCYTASSADCPGLGRSYIGKQGRLGMRNFFFLLKSCSATAAMAASRNKSRVPVLFGARPVRLDYCVFSP